MANTTILQDFQLDKSPVMGMLGSREWPVSLTQEPSPEPEVQTSK